MLWATPGYWKRRFAGETVKFTVASEFLLLTHLDLHGHLPPVLQPRQMHLADGRRRKRLLLEVLQLLPPARAQVAADGFLQREKNPAHPWAGGGGGGGDHHRSVLYRHLLGRHEVGALPNSLEDFGQLRVDERIVWGGRGEEEEEEEREDDEGQR